MNFWSTRIATMALFFFGAVVTPHPRAQVGSNASNATQNRKRMAQAVESTLQQGLPAKLPPHISTLLGLTNETEWSVMQGVVRTGKLVQGFDVSAADHNDVVIFFVDEATNNQTLFLTSRTGALRRIVKVEAGDGRVVKITDNERKAFEKEKQFWLNRLAPVAMP